MYSLAVAGKIVLGKVSRFEADSQPSVTFRPQICIGNIPLPGFFLLDLLVFTNVDVLYTAEAYSPRRSYSPGPVDGYYFLNQGRGARGLFPLNPDKIEAGGHFPETAMIVTPDNRIRVGGLYTGMVPRGYVEGHEYTLSFILTGETV